MVVLFFRSFSDLRRTQFTMRRRAIAQSLSIALLFIFHGLFAQSQDSVAPMEEREQAALYSAIQGFVGDQWNGSGLYPDPCGWTPIQGVSCDLFNGLWHITVLKIGPVLDNSLQCSPNARFDPELFELKHLRILSFYNCFFSLHQSTTIPPPNWHKLASSLETLEFRSNSGLTGPIPAEFTQLTNLQSLVIIKTGLSGELPRELGNLVNLRRLVISSNGFSSEIPVTLGGSMTELLILDLSRNSLTGSLPASLGSLNSLLKLDLSSNLLQGRIPPELGKISRLTLLDLRNNSLCCGLVQSLHNLVSLQELFLSGNQLGGSLNGLGWEKMASLTALDLSNLGLVGSIPESITRLRRLRFLALDHNNLSGTVPAGLAELPRFDYGSNPNLGIHQWRRDGGASGGLRNSVERRDPDENSSLPAASGSRVSGFQWLVALIVAMVL